MAALFDSGDKEEGLETIISDKMKELFQYWLYIWLLV